MAALALSACSLKDLRSSFISKNGQPSDIQDQQQGLTRQDFRDLNKADKLLPKNVEETASLGAPPIPDIAQVLAAPRPPKIANSKLVTISVTEDVPLRDVLFELGRLANVDIEVGTGLEHQGINLRATDRPFNEVIQRIADLGGLRYSVDGNSIRVERDTPYIKNYPLDFLNIVRSSSSSYSLSTNVLSGSSSSSSGGSSSSTSSSSSSSSSGTGGGGVGTSGTTSSITATADSDLWSALQSSITEILSYSPQVGMAANPAEAGSAGAGGGVLAPGAVTPPVGAAGAGGAAALGASSSGFVLNKQAGILSVNATQRQHEMIERFLGMMTRSVSAQVLIEAKIVEVALTDQFASGIDWSHLIGQLGHTHIALGNWQPIAASATSPSLTTQPIVGLAGVTNPTTGITTNPSSQLTLGIEGGDLDSLIALTETFGTTRTLSSPRLSAINNQQAVLTFAENKIFFNCTLPTGTTQTSGLGGGSGVTTTGASVDCQPSSVPLGIILSIMPSINLDSGEITLSVRPTLTSEVDEVPNPSIAIAAAAYHLTLTGSVPEIEVREIDSVMKVKSGGVMVIGGLMEDNTATQNAGIPGASELPLLGNLFKSRSESMGKRELIIFIKATIVNPDGSAHPVDRAVYERYTTDPRPLFGKPIESDHNANVPAGPTPVTPSAAPTPVPLGTLPSAAAPPAALPPTVPAVGKP